MKRCFVALDLPPEARTELSRLLKELGRVPRSAAGKLRLVAEQNLHVTIKFLGDTAEEQIAAVIDGLTDAANAVPWGEADLIGLDAFPGRARPKVVFAAIGAGRDTLGRLVSEVDRVCATLGFIPEARDATPHATLARVERPQPDGALTRFIEEHAEDAFGPVNTRHLVVYESRLTPNGAIYHALAKIPWGAS